MALGNACQRVFREDRDYQRFMDGLEATVDKFAFEVFRFGLPSAPWNGGRVFVGKSKRCGRSSSVPTKQRDLGLNSVAAELPVNQMRR